MLRFPRTRMIAGICSQTTLIGLLALTLNAQADEADNPVSAGYGREPYLPEPDPSLIPTVNIAPAVGWPENRAPVPAPDTEVIAFAQNLDHPRWLHVLPNGDVLVAETNAQPKETSGLRSWVMDKVQSRAGATVPSADRITLLRDTDGDGVADFRSILLQDLTSPFGMALIGNELFVANTDAIMRYPYQPGDTTITAAGSKLVDLPAGEINHHWTKNLIASPDGSKLYVTVGSNSNVAENGMEAEEGRAAIWEVDPASGEHRLYATGLRNPNGMAWVSGTLWTVVNERDEIGSELVPDYMTSVQDGGFYGWPYSYFGQHVDIRIEPQRPELVAEAIRPDYALGTHTGSLGLAYASDNANGLPPRFANGMFIGQHGSWNREPRSGYRVLFVPFAEGAPTGMPADVLSGFVNAEGDAYGRPVSVVLDQDGTLLVADDVGNSVWRVRNEGAL